MTDLQQVPTTAPPAGWYPDPSGEGARRWWSGMGWTEHLEEAAQPPGQPGSTETAQVSAEKTPHATQAPQAPQAPRAPIVSAALVGRDPDDIAREQAAWHSRSAATVQRTQGASVSIATPVAASKGERRNWISGVAMFVAIMSIPALGANVLGLLPPLTVSIFSGAPVGIALLAVVMAFRNQGRGALLSITALVLSTIVLLAGLFVSHPILRQIADVVMSWLPG